MSVIVTVVLVAVAGLAVGLLLLGVRAGRHLAALRATEARLGLPDRGAFAAGLLSDLPAPARRFLRRALSEGAPLARFVVLAQRARMKVSGDRPHVELRSRETLAPGLGFVWRARARMMGLPFVVTDHYLADAGSMRVAALGLLPVVNATDADTARSARGRLAAEAIWCPSSLVLRDDVHWEPVDDRRARLLQTIDGEALELVITVDGDGRVRELTMERWGDQGRPDHGMIPYGFEVLEETTFAGCTIPSRLRGGWWYGSDRYEPEDASEFFILDAAFGCQRR